MNKHLQNLMKILQQDESLPADQKQAALQSLKDAGKELEIMAFKLERTEKVKHTTAILLEETIEELEQKRKAVEAQNRELEIETALERVRTVAMGMRTPDDLLDICEILYTEFQLLDFNELRNAMINIYLDDKTYFLNYDYAPGPGKTVTHIPYNFHPLINKQVSETKNAGDAFIEFSFADQELRDFRELRKNNGEQDDPKLDGCSSLHYYFYSFGTGSIGISTYNAVTVEKKNVLKRFRNVFDLAYKRYVDIARAEAQAREAQIETALEKVRSGSLAMHKSDELKQVVKVVFKELQGLDFAIDGAAFIVTPIENSKDFNVWIGDNHAEYPTCFITPLYDTLSVTDMAKAFESETGFFSRTYSFEEKNSWFQYAFEHTDYKTLPDQLKTWILEQQYLTQSIAFAKKSGVGIHFHYQRTLTENEIDVLKRFSKVFDQAYIRFLDLQKAEAQAKEAQIEAALERVRAQAMSMMKSDELLNVCQSVFTQIQSLGFSENLLRNAQININQDEKGFYYAYQYSDYKGAEFAEVPYNLHPVVKLLSDKLRQSKEAFADIVITGEQLNDWKNFVNNFPQKYDEKLNAAPEIHYYFYSVGIGALGISTFKQITDDQLQILKRFRNVFDLSYKRYSDIALAEAQAREAQIEAALERVRSRSLAMHKSEELKEVIGKVLEQFIHLNIKAEHAGFYIDYKVHDDMHIWLADPNLEPFYAVIPYFDTPTWNSFLEAKAKGTTLHTDLLDFETKNKFYESLFKLFTIPEEAKEFYSQCKGLAVSTVLLDSVGLYIENFDGTPYTDDENNILLRFGKVFQQAYTRFLDLQKAEAQARESQIQLAMERVRARTMAMQKSDELKDAAALLFQQVKALGVPAYSCGYNIWEKGETTFTSWMGPEDGSTLNPVFNIPLTEDANFIRYAKSKQNGEEFFVLELRDQRMQEHYAYLKTIPAFKAYFDYAVSMGFDLPETQIHHVANFSNGNLLFITIEPCPEFHDVFKRFAAVFDQTYTRFLDLQKAEAQAREARIEAALERVRSKTMGMQNSNELADAASLLFNQVSNFGIHVWSSGFNIWQPDGVSCIINMCNPDGSIAAPYPLPHTEYIFFQKIYEAWRKGEDFLVMETGGKELVETYQYMFSFPEVKKMLTGMEDTGIQIPKFQVNHCAFFSQGYLMFITYEACPEMWDIFKRFAKVFEQTYTRFLDLQRAESQAREATKQASLDRVRGQIASMRSTEDLQRITPLIWHELTMLGVPFIRCGVLIIDEVKAEAHIYLSSPDGHSLAAMNLPLQSNTLTANSLAYWRKGLVYTEHWSREDFIHWMQSMIEQGQVQNPETYQGAAKPPESLQLHFVPFTQGMLYVGNTELLADDAIDLVKSLAEAFSIAYARYEDFTKLEKAKQSIETTLTELKAAQSQLIQSEKMASLGELTAGIAHEIQNPLNFVNNFSEVNIELLAEMTEEIDKGNFEEARSLAKDVTDNEEKINHHGKRADAIVKGMLQHSRSSTGVKEPTDINQLADEYLRLSYHGLRAKDKTFNANLQTDFEERLEKVPVIPQDIGRVLLNLYNNAFYAVNEKAKLSANSLPTLPTGQAGYQPAVEVKTHRINGKIEIKVSDNGNGIPQKIVDKIFQPFFTTKPTGEGTGLGLSLSYDIIKAHGGELKVETKEGKGSEFIIYLPASV